MHPGPSRFTSLLVLTIVAASCTSQPGSQRAIPANAKLVDETKAGRISGRIMVGGPVPANPAIDMGSDAVCARQNADGSSAESFVVENGGLNNVFVYIKDGLGQYYFETPSTTVKLDQQACRYKPHVFGVQTGQPVEITNSDPTTHNVAGLARENRSFNYTQPVQGFRNTTKFTSPEVAVRFSCNVHTWMTAYAGVVEHPYFVVTTEGGAFELKNVPAGTYVIEAWHEKLGTQTQSVTLGERESKQLNFTFRATSEP